MSAPAKAQQLSYIRHGFAVSKSYPFGDDLVMVPTRKIIMPTAANRNVQKPSLDFLIGHDQNGSWFVIETHGLAGGYFRSEREAFKYVLADFHCRAKRIEVVEEAVDAGGTCVEVANRCRHASKHPAP